MRLAAVILAGGRSQRMGEDKALLQKDGVSLLRHTWEVAQALTPTVWIVTPRRDRYQSLLPATAQWIAEYPPDSGQAPAGPIMAFRQALQQIPTDWVLLLACDLPNLQPEVLQQWREDLSQLPAGAIAYLPQTSKGWEPLCGFYRSSCLTSLQTYTAQGKRSFQGWLDQQLVVPIPQVPTEMLANCNTPEDWKRLIQS